MKYKLYKRGKYYQIGWTESGKKFARSLKATTNSEALRLFKQFETDNATDKTYRLSELLELYLQTAAKKLRTTHITEVIRIINLFITVNGDKPIKHYTQLDVNRFQSFGQDQPVRDATNNIRYRCVKMMFNFAVKVGLLPKNPFVGTKQIKVPKGKPTFIPMEKFNDFIQSVKHTDLRDIVIFAALSGCRLSEITYLRWSSIDFQNNEILIANNDEFVTKTGKERKIPIHPDVRILLERRSGGMAKSLYVFSKSTGVRYSNSYVTHSFKEYATQYGLDKEIHFHSLRHTFASWLIQSNANIYDISNLLGHSTVKVTEIYSHLTPTKLQNTVNLINVKKPKLKLVEGA